MLGDHPITPVLLAKDLAASRAFYHDKLGLEILKEDENDIVFKCGGGTHVEDIRSEVGELRARGVEVENYDSPGLKTDGGIADLEFVWAAWIVDPGKNVLGIVQFKG